MFSKVSDRGGAISTAPETRARIVAMAESLPPQHKAMIAIWLEHWWAEVIYDIEACVRTLSDDVSYRAHGAATFGEDIAIDGRDNARAMYQGLFDAGLMPGGPFDEEQFAFNDQGLMMEGLFTSIFPGAMMPGVPGLDPDGLYKMRWRMAVSHPIDVPKGVLKGEIMYPGPPISVEPSDRAEISRLLGR